MRIEERINFHTHIVILQKMIKTNCFQCKREIKKRKWSLSHYERLFCSDKCFRLSRRKSGPFTHEEFHDLYYKQNLSIREIAKMSEMSISGIYIRARRMGFKLRDIKNCATERTKEKMSKAWDYKKHITDSYRKNVSIRMLGHLVSEETKKKIGIKSRINTLRLWKNKDYREKQSNGRKGRKVWNKGLKGCYSQETIEKIRQARLKQRIPRFNTEPERKFIELIKKYDLPYKYVGNGEIWIHHKNPDFINVNGKKEVVEVFGRYWHTKGQGLSGKTREENKTKEHYKQYGFDCVVIWDDEIDNKQLVLSKLGIENRNYE